MDMLDLVAPDFVEYVPLSKLVGTKTSPDLKQSPTMSKTQGKRAQQQQSKQAMANKNQPPTAPIPNPTVNYNGLNTSVQLYLEFIDTFSTMTSVFGIAQNHGGNITATEALHIYTSQLNQQQQQQQHQQQQQQQQQQPQQPPQHSQPMLNQQFNPSLPPQQQMMGGVGPNQFGVAPPNNFLSPAHPNQLNMPVTSSASPSTLSNHNTPAMPNMSLQHQTGQASQGLMAAPSSVAMAHQASHQGTNPSAAGTPSAAANSANASPNVGVTGKRRRPSGIDDGDVNGPSVNGVGPAGAGNNQASMKGKQGAKGGGKKARANQ